MDPTAQLARAGFDVVHAFDAQAIADPAWAHLARGPRLGLLVGNTRALWAPFLAARERDPALAADANPLERYTERSLAAAFPRADVVYSHRRYDGAFLPFQRLAIATGLGAIAPIGLVIHPTYGPWFALRAVVAIEGEPPARAPIELPCRCDASCHAALARAQTEGGWQAWLAVRDACAVRDWRYSDDQIRYHYTHAWPTLRTSS